MKKANPNIAFLFVSGEGARQDGTAWSRFGRVKGKTEIAYQEFEAVRLREPKPPREDPWRRLSGLHSVRGRKNLAVARALWQARESFAQFEDTAPGRLLPDRSIIAAVRALPGRPAVIVGGRIADVANLSDLGADWVGASLESCDRFARDLAARLATMDGD